MRHDLLHGRDACGVLYFGKEAAAARAALLHGLSDFPKVLRPAHKGLHDVRYAEPCRIPQIHKILLSQRIPGDGHSLCRYALAAQEFSACQDARRDRVPLRGMDKSCRFQLSFPVINEEDHTVFIMREDLRRHGDRTLRGKTAAAVCQFNGFPFFQDTSLFNIADPQFGSLHIDQEGRAHACLSRRLVKRLDHTGAVLQRSMGQVQSHACDSCFKHLSEDPGIRAGRSQCSVYLQCTHVLASVLIGASLFIYCTTHKKTLL